MYCGVSKYSSVQSLSRVQLFATAWTAARQDSLSITNSQSLPNSCPLSWWCHATISSSVVPFSSCLQSFPASRSFPVSQYWFPLGLTGLISLQSKVPSRFFSNTTVQKHQLFGTQLSLWPNSHIHTWLLEKNHSFD